MAKDTCSPKNLPPKKNPIVHLEVNIIKGPMTDAFAQENPIVSRTF